MSEEKKRKTVRKTRVAAKVGKADLATKSSGVETTLAGTKYRAGGAKPKRKAGGIVRKPVPKIRYSKKAAD
jgi:hypothetical protein